MLDSPSRCGGQPKVLTQVNVYIQNARLPSNNQNERPGPSDWTGNLLGLNCPGKWIILALKLTVTISHNFGYSSCIYPVFSALGMPTDREDYCDEGDICVAAEVDIAFDNHEKKEDDYATDASIIESALFTARAINL
nr:hypothetical transcript [Hymenolepis microstoma]